MKLSKITKTFTFFLIAAFSLLSVWVVVQFSEYYEGHLLSVGIENVPIWLLHLLGGLFVLPCVAVLVLALPLSDAMQNDTVFTQKTARAVFLIAGIICGVCVCFLFAVVCLLATKEYLFASVFGALDLIGFALSVLLWVLSDYVRRAALLKEEADATL